MVLSEVVYFRKLLFTTNDEKFSLGRFKSKKMLSQTVAAFITTKKV